MLYNEDSTPEETTMADQQHLEQLQKGSARWNNWRAQHPEIRPDLSGIDLTGANLSGTNLSGANLIEAKLKYTTISGANLSGAKLIEAYLFGADLTRADLTRADLSAVDLNTAILVRAKLIEAILSDVDLFGADLTGADLTGATLYRANLSRAILTGATLSKARIEGTTFGDADLRDVNGLETIIHHGPSTIGIDTIVHSAGALPEVFLRGAGIPEPFIIYIHSLITRPIEYYTCFISYNHNDEAFAQRLYADLQNKGVRCWFAPEAMKTGDKIRERIDESIRLYDKLLVVLSEHSIYSSWVEKEVETAFEKEKRLHKQVLFPIRLDDTVLDTDQAWAADLRRMRHIGDFCRWKQHDDYQQAFARLLRDLRQESPPISSK
jgi:hypothetical protein